MENIYIGLNGVEQGKMKKRNSKNKTLDTASHCKAGKGQKRKDCVKSSSLGEKRNWKNDRENLKLPSRRYTLEEILMIVRRLVNYIGKREWGFLEGLQKILCMSKHEDVPAGWIKISKNLPS